VALPGPVAVLHVPLELDVEAHVRVDRVEDELQRRERLVVVVRLLLKVLRAGRLLRRVERLQAERSGVWGRVARFFFI
jgi:hypothetical protein